MKLPSRITRVAMVATLAVGSVGSFLYVADASEGPDYSNVVVPKVLHEGPASVSAGDAPERARTASPTVPITFRRVSNDIPAAAQAAYQHSAELVNAVSPCHLDWTLLAAIGRIETDHGRFGKDTSGAGSRRPGDIYGIRLDGTHGTARITDTDGGKLDGDTQFDRAVGPMQFLPATWRGVEMDGDNDKLRDPQDIDDATLGSAVYLCAGAGDLSGHGKVEAAILRYNHSQKYVDQVLALMRSYAAGSEVAPATGPGPYAPADVPTASGSPKNKTQQRHTAAKPRKSGGTPKPASPHQADTPVLAAPKPAQAVSDPVKVVMTPVQEATTLCQRQLDGTQLNAAGGLTSCVKAFLSGGQASVRGLLGAVGSTLDPVLGKK
jgi:membrane-bound lytic murein transglycosylase B